MHIKVAGVACLASVQRIPLDYLADSVPSELVLGALEDRCEAGRTEAGRSRRLDRTGSPPWAMVGSPLPGYIWLMLRLRMASEFCSS